GFAWSTAENWVVRGGFGMFSQPWSEDYYSANVEGLGASTSCGISDPTQLTPVMQFSSTAPNLNCNPASKNPGGYNGQGIQYYPYHTPAARIYQWSLSVEREIAKGLVAEAAYVGNHGKNLPFAGVDFNQVPANLLQQSISNSSQAQSLRPYPQFQGISASGGNYNALTNYDALQLSLKKRFSHGLTFDANYTWSKMLSEQDSSGWSGNGGPTPYQDSYNPALNYGLSNLNRGQLVKADFVYQLPFGKGNGPVEWIAGGWQASAILTYQSGQPYTLYVNGPNNSGALAGSWFPNVVGNPVLSNPTLQEWFNTAAFATPASGTWGNAGRNILIGPDFFDLDFSMAKSFGIPKLESGRLQLRFDANNILNHTSFSNPNATIGSLTAGLINGTTNSGRLVQLGARLSF
ncbi:MAG: carboxypeptidase regulatory-like domain-containing protein, partial [Bryobacteraceae bacterium]